MKVCFVTANHPPEALGGTEQVVQALARELRRHGVEIVVVSGSDEPHAGVDVGREVHDGVVVHRIRKCADEWDRQGFVRPRILGLVRTLLQVERPDVLHVHSSASLGVGVAPLARELGLPVVFTFHDLWVTCARYFRLPIAGVTCPDGADREPCVRCVATDVALPPDVVRQALAERDRVVRAEVAHANACIAPSATTARFVREYLPFAGAIEVIPHGLLHPVAAADRAVAPQPGERLRVGTFGGLVEAKGVPELLDAVRGLPCDLYLAGRVHEAAIARRLDAARAAGTTVHWRGPYMRQDRHPARDLHLAVFPSKCQETYGLVVDEALAHGVPVVCSDAGALRERDGIGGVVVTPLAALAEVLRSLVTSADRLAELRAAIPATLPTIAVSAARHLELYSRLR
ncbi:MAG: glycosyltransferase [Planctomycetes bacterium]|nr:glycosyltransferase [Planctomycetota bacterium]